MDGYTAKPVPADPTPLELHYAGYPAAVAADPSGEDWRGPPGQPGPPGPTGPAGGIDVANVQTHGADPTGATDSTAAITAAIATGKPVYVPAGMYRVTDMITLGKGQIMSGDGRLQSMLRVNSTSFNMIAAGVVKLYQGEPSSQLMDIGIGFTQPDTTSRANLALFPPAILARGAQRGKLIRIRVDGAYIGLDARGNTVLTIEDLEIGAISKGMMWGSLISGDGNGAKDFNHWAKLSFFPYGFNGTPNIAALYNDGNTISGELGEIDGLLCSGYTAYNSRLVLTADATNHTYALANVSLDAPYGYIDIQGAPLHCAFANLTLNTDVSTTPKLRVAGGNVHVTSARLTSSGSDAIVRVTGGVLTMVGGTLYQANAGAMAAEVTGGQMLFQAMNFLAGSSRTASFIKQTGGSLAVNNCHFLAGGSGVGIEYTADTSANKLIGVSWNNMTAIVPGTATPSGQYVGPILPTGQTQYIIKGSGAAAGLLLGAMDTATPFAQFFGKTRRYAQSGLTAAGSTQADALVLSRDFNRVVTVASGAGVKFLPSVVGMEYRVSNGGANPLKIYADGSDTINGTAGATGVTLAAGAKGIWWCNVASAWDGGTLT